MPLTLASNAITFTDSTSLSSGIIGTAQLSAGTVTTQTIANSAVTQQKLASNVAGTGPTFSAYASAATTLQALTTTKVNFQAIRFNVGSCYNSSTSRFTPNVPGYYLITASIRADITSNVAMHTYIVKNDNLTISAGSFVSTTQSQACSPASVIEYFNGTTDFCSIYGYVGTTGNTYADAGQNSQTTFTGCLLRSA